MKKNEKKLIKIIQAENLENIMESNTPKKD